MNKIELDGETYTTEDSYLRGLIDMGLIKPISPKEQEKQLYYVLSFGCYSSTPSIELLDEGYTLTPTQAQAVAEAITALMEFIFTENTANFIDFPPTHLLNLMDKARAIRKGQS